jgi:hypothetical protein
MVRAGHRGNEGIRNVSEMNLLVLISAEGSSQSEVEVNNQGSGLMASKVFGYHRCDDMKL